MSSAGDRLGKKRVLRWDPYLEPNEGDMEFRLTYSGMLKAHRDDKRLPERSLHVHDIRRKFHQQLKKLRSDHPVFRPDTIGFIVNEDSVMPPPMDQIFNHDEFRWQPIVTEANGLICKLDVLLLRAGAPGKVLHDVDNRLKTLFDALRKAKGPQELGGGTSQGMLTAQADEDPFFVLLEDDRLITHVSVTTDMLLEPVDSCPPDEAVRLVVDVTVRPYHVHLNNQGYV